MPSLKKLFLIIILCSSVADPNPGFGAFSPWTRDEFFPDTRSVTFFEENFFRILFLISIPGQE
jgi:hypothetical protein